MIILPKFPSDKGISGEIHFKGESHNMNVLVINAGSSSLKYQLMDPATREVLA